MLQRELRLLTLVLLPLVAACPGKRDDGLRDDHPPLRTTEMGSMNNVCVAGSIWFGSVPSPDDLDLAKRRGIESVIDVCGSSRDENPALVSRCDELGLDYLSVRMAAGADASAGAVDLVLARLADADERPTLLFCESGANSAMLFAIHRVVHDGVDVEAALVEARKAGMKPGAPEEFVLRQIERLTGWTLVDRSGESASGT